MADKPSDPPTPLGMRRLPASDPDEAIERVLPRKLVVPGTGDVLLYREPAGVKVPEAMWRFRVQILGTNLSSGTFATYEHAVTHAEQLAAERRVRLFYAEARDGQTSLLKDARTRR
jgi:hypothetical protein